MRQKKRNLSSKWMEKNAYVLFFPKYIEFLTFIESKVTNFKTMFPD